MFLTSLLTGAAGALAYLVIRGLYRLWREGDRERSRARGVRLGAEIAAKDRAEFHAQFDEAWNTDPDWQKHVRELKRAGYEPPQGVTDERWPALREKVKADLGRRWKNPQTGPVMPAMTEAVGWHARGLRRLNRIRRTLGAVRAGRR